MTTAEAVQKVREFIRLKHFSLGHKSLETTMGYLHAEALSVKSPLDA